jgi:hypothetical protein
LVYKKPINVEYLFVLTYKLFVIKPLSNKLFPMFKIKYRATKNERRAPMFKIKYRATKNERRAAFLLIF